MKAIGQLLDEYLLLRAGAGNFEACIDWAIERLRHDDEGDDLDIVLLAGATEEKEAAALVERIIERYCSADVRDDELAVGKYIVQLRKSYLRGEETIASIDLKLTSIVRRFGYLGWLMMLARNCEYATDVSVFEQPFEQEFAYIAGLWESATSLAGFESAYSPEVSRQHDAR